MKIDSLSVFFPAYNEAENIAATVEKAILVLNGLDLKQYEVIIVDDGSKDETGKIADNLASQNNKIRVIHQSNGGYGVALQAGFYNAKYPWIVFTDSDGQFDFSEVTKLLQKSDEADVIIGYRINRQDPLLRRLFGWGWTLLANILLGIRTHDVDCAFKLIKKEVIDTIPHLKSQRGGMISPELLAKARKNGFKIVEVGVHHYPRSFGHQTGADFGVIFKSFVDLFKLWWQLQ
ncbi:glycosyltransferase family 2 protein [Candidatus Daviesbacteria bacterium]|nr:glycosyltransferase family 2 protein [Candidatus Daviesbacteria bacterium]